MCVGGGHGGNKLDGLHVAPPEGWPQRRKGGGHRVGGSRGRAGIGLQSRSSGFTTDGIKHNETTSHLTHPFP
jgi:hypothetical protein